MKILVALSRFPWPLEKGDKLRAWYQIQGLAEHHEVHLVCLSDLAVTENDLKQVGFCKSVQVIPLPKWRVGLNLLGGIFNRIPFQVNYFRSAAMRRVIRETIQREKIDACYVQLIRLGENLPHEFVNLRWVLDYMDTFSMGMSQRIETDRWWSRPVVKMETRRLRAYETRIAAHFDELTIISKRDAEGLAPLHQESVHVIPNGVSESFFEEMPRPSELEWDIIFFGNMGYLPNVQSARFLVEEVLPILHARGLRPKLCIAGARPAPIIQSWASPEITVTGFVADIREFVVKSKISVAPLLGGQGMQNKLLESMAMSLPTITSGFSNEGVRAVPGEHLVVCNTALEFADAIQDLLAHPEKAAHLAQNGRKFVEQHFRWSRMNAMLEAVITGQADAKKS
ncbi:MAG: glycosyltransferase [Bacteroidia bacterium]